MFDFPAAIVWLHNMAVSSTTDLLQEALALHRQGAVAEAAARYADVLRAEPGNADAHYYLGMMSCQHGRFAEGAKLARQALASDPRHARAHVLLGRALSALGGNDEALASFARAIALAPDLAPAHGHLADLLSDLGRNGEAVDSYDRALALAPENTENWFNRGVALNAAGRREEAVASFDRAIAGKPDFLQARLARAKALSDLRRHNDALEGVDKVLAMEPALAEAWLGRGNVLTTLKRHEEAFAAYDRALALKPDLAEAWLGRGNVLFEAQNYKEALATYEKALSLNPTLAEAWLGRGNISTQLKEHDRALDAYERALTLRPDLAGAWLGRGTVFLEAAHYDKAFAAFDKASELNPELDFAASLRLHAKMQTCDWTNFEAEAAALLANKTVGAPLNAPFAILSIESSAADQLQRARAYVQAQPQFPYMWRGEVYSHDRIRIAYLSGDFREHAVAYLTAGLLEQHDKSRFELWGLSLGPDDNSELRRRIASACEHFVDVKDKSDQDISHLIRDREIDIVVDLMGYTTNHRHNIVARRAAPIQVNYLGFPGTLGADYVDYIIAVPTIIPRDQIGCYAEQVVWLPDCYLAGDHKRLISDRTPTRRQCGLPEAGFVFCSFNNAYKITPKMFAVWMRLLNSVPGSVLWLKKHNAAAQRNLRREAQSRGVDPQRLVFAPFVPVIGEHLARYRHADLFLDTLPYNAHTTASDALCAGVPVLTCLGGTFAGRVAASLLAATGLDELIASSLEEYEHVAFKLARNPSHLESLKTRLANDGDFPLSNTKRFARHIEAAYETMVDIQRRGESPRSFSVEPASQQRP